MGTTMNSSVILLWTTLPMRYNFNFCVFQVMMFNRRQTPAYDNRYKGWRGPRLEGAIDETGGMENMVSPNHFFSDDVTKVDF